MDPVSAETCRLEPGSQSASSTARTENPVAHQNAMWNEVARLPWCAAMPPERMTARTAVPNEPPICWTVRVTTLEWAICCTPAEVRARVIGNRPVWSHEIFRRAYERGELDLEKIPAAVLTMPFDLMRHDLLMTLKPVPPERITAIIDDLFLPLVAAYRPEKT